MSSDQAEKRQALGGVWPEAQPGLKPPAHPPGPTEMAPFKPEGELHELSTKLLLHYSPQVLGVGQWARRCYLPLPPTLCVPPPLLTDPGCLRTPCPQACRNNICLDLSPGHGLDGRLTGHRVETWDVKVHVRSGARAHACVGQAGEPPRALRGHWRGPLKRSRVPWTQLPRLDSQPGRSGAGMAGSCPPTASPSPRMC